MELLLMFGLPLALSTVTLASVAAAIVWGMRALVGLRAGLIAGRIVMVLLALLPVWLVAECVVAMNTPPTIIGDMAIDNDGTVRTLLLAGPIIIPAAIFSAVPIWFSNRFFSRRLKNVSSTCSGATA